MNSLNTCNIVALGLLTIFTLMGTVLSDCTVGSTDGITCNTGEQAFCAPKQVVYGSISKNYFSETTCQSVGEYPEVNYFRVRSTDGSIFNAMIETGLHSGYNRFNGCNDVSYCDPSINNADFFPYSLYPSKSSDLVVTCEFYNANCSLCVTSTFSCQASTAAPTSSPTLAPATPSPTFPTLTPWQSISGSVEYLQTISPSSCYDSSSCDYNCAQQYSISVSNGIVFLNPQSTVDGCSCNYLSATDTGSNMVSSSTFELDFTAKIIDASTINVVTVISGQSCSSTYTTNQPSGSPGLSTLAICLIVFGALIFLIGCGWFLWYKFNFSVDQKWYVSLSGDSSSMP